MPRMLRTGIFANLPKSLPDHPSKFLRNCLHNNVVSMNQAVSEPLLACQSQQGRFSSLKVLIPLTTVAVALRHAQLKLSASFQRATSSVAVIDFN